MATEIGFSSAQPLHYLVVGNGRLARHLDYYLQILKIRFSCWNRSLPIEQLHSALQQSSHVLLAISDSSLQSFYDLNLSASSTRKTVVHFSGAMNFSGMNGAHPLMTFGPELYQEHFYKQIPFVTCEKKHFSDILPGFPNRHYQISKDQKTYYHALCVLGGNLTTLLLQRMVLGFTDLGLPKEIAEPYIRQVFSNVFLNPQAALTGPFARKDALTVTRNLESLKNDSFADVYRSFLPIAFPEYQEKTT